jgi:Tol biopolymer transport system component
MKSTRSLLLPGILLGLAATVALAGKPQKPPKPPPSEADPAIAYVTYGPKGCDLHVMDADGGNATRIYRSEVGGLWYPSWSPDGTRIAFIEQFDLMVIEVTVVNGVPVGGTPTRLVSSPSVSYPAWAPDGDLIAYAPIEDGLLQVIPAEGGTPTALFTAPDAYRVRYPTWSPDASEIAFVVGSEAGPILTVLDVDSKLVTASLDLPGGDSVTDLDWSRAGDRVVFERGVHEIHTWNPGTGAVAWLCDGQAPSWSPDDTRLVYTDGQKDKQSVYEIALATGAVTQLARSGRWPDWRR